MPAARLDVTLGGVSPALHEHIYTGNASAPVLSRVLAGQFVTFSKEVYRTYFFPAFLNYHLTYQLHVLGAGVWLVTGVWNLRKQPGPRAKDESQTSVQPAAPRWHRAVGYVYVLTSAAKGATALTLTAYSHSLGFSRLPLAGFALWDLCSLAVALLTIRR